MITNFKLFAIWSEWNNFKWAMIPDMKGKIHETKRANSKGFEQTSHAEVVREDILEEGQLNWNLKTE